MSIVHDADEWSLRGNVRDQSQDGKADEGPIRRVSVAETEDGLEGRTLRLGQAPYPVENRCAELVKRREGQLHLRLDSCSAQDPHVMRRCNDMVQECGLSYTRIASEDKSAALASSHCTHHGLENRALILTPAKRCPLGRCSRLHTSYGP